MEFIKFDENQKISYFGPCKITVNTLSKQLIIEPVEEGNDIHESMDTSLHCSMF